MKPIDAAEAFKHLMSLPLDVERPKLHVLLPFSPKTLAARAKKFTTPTHFPPNPVPAWTVLPRYADWLKAASRPRTLKPSIPTIPSGSLDLSTYIWEYERHNGLALSDQRSQA